MLATQNTGQGEVAFVGVEVAAGPASEVRALLGADRLGGFMLDMMIVIFDGMRTGNN